VQHRQTPTFVHGHHSARGGASWYASPFGSDSCASRSLPRGTIVSIVNLDNGRSATCRVADYGPVARARVLDLDNDVFRRLSPLGIGVIPVSISW
jgi:rare lipoprotein A